MSGTAEITTFGVQGEPATAALSFHVSNVGAILTITADGKLVRGIAFADDDRASVAFLECLAAHVPCFLAELRTRAERAEAKLAFLETAMQQSPGAKLN